MKEFIFGTFVYKYQLIKQERKTLSLTVTPDLKIVLRCPMQADDERIEKFFKKEMVLVRKTTHIF